MTTHTSFFVQPGVTISVEVGTKAQWLRIDNGFTGMLTIFADDEQLRMIRDAIDAHLEKAEAASSQEAAPKTA